VGDDGFELADDVDLVGVRWSSSLDDARTTARQLVEHGVGARVEPAAADGVAGFEVRVLPDEAGRAEDVLGGGPVDGAPGEGPAPGAAPAPRGGEGAGGADAVPWRLLALIGVAALVLVPLAVGVLTYLLLSH
jgi:hypothetical protein